MFGLISNRAIKSTVYWTKVVPQIKRVAKEVFKIITSKTVENPKEILAE